MTDNAVTVVDDLDKSDSGASDSAARRRGC